MRNATTSLAVLAVVQRAIETDNLELSSKWRATIRVRFALIRPGIAAAISVKEIELVVTNSPSALSNNSLLVVVAVAKLPDVGTLTGSKMS